MREEQLLAYLREACPGRRYAVRGEELERVLGLSSSDLRKLVNRLRRKGKLIGSSPEGYFYIKTFGEARATIRQLERMIQGLEAAKRGLEQGLDEVALSETGGEGHR